MVLIFEKLTKRLKTVYGEIKGRCRGKMKCSALNINMYCIKNPAKSELDIEAGME